MRPISKFLIAFVLITCFQLTSNLQAQNNSIVLDGAYIVLDGGTETTPIYVVVDQPDPSGITRLPSGGHIHSENQYNYVKWLSGSNQGSYTFPFGVDGTAGDYIPLTFDKTAGSNSISSSTWSTDQQNMPHPATSNVGPVTTMNNGVTDSVEYALDRFWDIQADGNTADLTFSYRGSENTTTTPSALLQAQHWDGTAWDAPVGPGTAGVTTGIGTAGPFTGQNTFSPWVLIAPCTPDSVTQDPEICQGEDFTVGTNTYTTTGTYIDDLTNSNGCDSVVTTNLTVHPPATGTDTQEACETFTWIDGNTYTTDNNTATHTIVGGSANGCDSIVTLDLTINDVATGTDVQVACGSFTWIDGNTYTSDNNSATHTITGGAANGCDSIVTLDLTIETLPSISANSNGPVCEGETLSFDATTVNGATYQWSGPNGFTSQDQNPSITGVNNSNAGTYQVIVSLGSNCTETAEVNVNINPSPLITGSITDDNCSSNAGQIEVDVTSANPPFTYSWSNGATGNLLTDLSEGIYEVTVTDATSCSSTKSFQVFNNKDDCGCFVYVANAFSPNGDGNNDFIPVRGKCVSHLSFKIFNRWGNLVFETEKLNDGWDGYYKGELQNSAVFVYKLEATFENGETVSESGDISLIR